MARVTKAARAEAVAWLKKWLRPGDTVYTVLRHRSQSGMYRAIDCYLFRPRGRSRRQVEKYWISYNVARATGYRFDEKREAVGIGGCGMDMGFAIVNSLSHRLFGWSKVTPLRHEWIG